MAERPKAIFIVDAAFQSGRRPCEIFEMEIAKMVPKKANDLSLHMFPAIYLLSDLQDSAGV